MSKIFSNHPPIGFIPLFIAKMAPIHANLRELSDTTDVITLIVVAICGTISIIFFIASWIAGKKIDRDRRKW